MFKYHGQPAYLNLRGYGEKRAQNRAEGYALVFRLAAPEDGKA